jgi:Fe-S oxidoreductase
MKESIISHVKVIIIIILTLANLLLLWNQEWFVVNSLIFVVRNIFLSIIFVKPFLNLLLNYDKPVHYFETPFKLKDIMEGRTKLENIKTSVETINDLSSRKKLSLSACLEIGVCEDVCPATSVLRPLSPRVFIRKLSILMQNKPEGNPFEVIGKDELWACTTCGACTSSCPLKVRHLEIILDLRRALVESGLLDEKKSEVLSSVVTYGNTFGMSNHSRNKWLEKLGVKTVDQNPNCKYLLWIGCLSSFDDRQRKIVEAFINILKHVGKVNEIAILGNLETCCGDPGRKLGDEGMFQEIALKNIELFEKYNVSSIITVCPHCYNVFKNEYRELDSREIKVIHHAEFLDMLFENKTLNNLRPLDKKIAVHDPCYLARYNRITPLMRRLEKVGSVRRPKKCGVNTYCCGGGGGNYWYEVPEKKRISHERLEQLLELKPDIIITFCPYCKAMLDDAAQAKELEHIKILDAAELISEQLKMV